MSFKGYELISLCGFGKREEKGYWETYSQNLVLSDKEKQYKSLKQLWDLNDDDIFILLQKCNYLDSGIREMSFVGLAAKKTDAEEFEEIEINGLGVIKFNPNVDSGTVVRIKDIETSDFIQSYFKLNRIEP
ncbi:MAG: hypothetical protein U9N57_07090 [Pseudomonadota bacterium]|nr:hypothetical protein [Pseudomonadota bacterium]